jgi:hypothetical protein
MNPLQRAQSHSGAVELRSHRAQARQGFSGWTLHRGQFKRHPAAAQESRLVRLYQCNQFLPQRLKPSAPVTNPALAPYDKGAFLCRRRVII